MKHIERLKKHIKDSTCLSLIDRLSTRKLHLLPGEIDESLSNDITNLSLNKHSSKARSSIKAGLFQWNDDLDRSHDICQDIHSSTGSYWHGIMHRREPDYWNGKYWFRKVGGHPVYSELASTAISIAEESYSDNPDVMANTHSPTASERGASVSIKCFSNEADSSPGHRQTTAVTMPSRPLWTDPQNQSIKVRAVL